MNPPVGAMVRVEVVVPPSCMVPAVEERLRVKLADAAGGVMVTDTAVEVEEEKAVDPP